MNINDLVRNARNNKNNVRTITGDIIKVNEGPTITGAETGNNNSEEFKLKTNQRDIFKVGPTKS